MAFTFTIISIFERTFTHVSDVYIYTYIYISIRWYVFYFFLNNDIHEFIKKNPRFKKKIGFGLNKKKQITNQI